HEREGGRWAQRHDKLRLQFDVIRAFMDLCPYQLKFVIEQPEDLMEVEEILEKLPAVDRARVLLMPQAVTPQELVERSAWLIESCKPPGFRYCPRLHIELFGNRRGT